MSQSRPCADAKPVVLVLDDDDAVRNSLKFTLEVEGFEVRDYSHAGELLSEGNLPLCCCLIVDYHMPAMNGLELVARLRDRRIPIPAILITSQPNDNMRAQAGAAGVPIVEKPFVGGRLLDCIREAFDGFGRRPA